MRAVPSSMREGSYAMGATRLETAFRVVVPAAVSGVLGAVILGMSRAIGETMIVVVAGGQQPQLVTSPTQQGATVTAFMAQVALGDIAFGTLEYNSIFAAGLVVVFNLLNVSGEQIAWVVSALAVGIGFGLQSIVRNLVSGIILLIERPVKVGDRVIVGDRDGVVDRITIRSTTVMTYSNVGIVIPNEELIAGQVINQSLGSPKLRL